MLVYVFKEVQRPCGVAGKCSTISQLWPDHYAQKSLSSQVSIEERLKELVETLWRAGGDLLLEAKA